jgi:hypothetical protein
VSHKYVDRSVADDRVGDATTGGLGKASLRDLGHSPIVCPT